MAALGQRSDSNSTNAGVTQLEFHQAMRDFKTMFPNMDEDVIEVVLRSNQGGVDATIDQLLAMNEDSGSTDRSQSEPIGVPGNLINELPPQYSSATPPPSYQFAVSPQDLSASPQSTRSDSMGKSNGHLVFHKFPCASANLYTSSSDSLRAKFKWYPPLLGTLPSSFLRVEAFGGHTFAPLTRKVSNTVADVSDSDHLSSALLQQVHKLPLLS